MKTSYHNIWFSVPLPIDNQCEGSSMFNPLQENVIAILWEWRLQRKNIFLVQKEMWWFVWPRVHDCCYLCLSLLRSAVDCGRRYLSSPAENSKRKKNKSYFCLSGSVILLTMSAPPEDLLRCFCAMSACVVASDLMIPSESSISRVWSARIPASFSFSLSGSRTFASWSLSPTRVSQKLAAAAALPMRMFTICASQNSQTHREILLQRGKLEHTHGNPGLWLSCASAPLAGYTMQDGTEFTGAPAADTLVIEDTYYGAAISRVF